jgi:hypothetical protein
MGFISLVPGVKQQKKWTGALATPPSAVVGGGKGGVAGQLKIKRHRVLVGCWLWTIDPIKPISLKP